MDKKKPSVKRPNPFVYYPIVTTVKLLSKLLFGVRIDKKALKKVKGPMVIVSNHASTLDVVLMASAIYPRRINVIASRDLFSFKVLRPFMKSMGVIGKNPFGMDIASLRKMIEAVKNGCNLGLYPEGKTSQDGSNIHYMPPVGKFIKMLGANVVSVRALGSFCTKHRFQKGFSHGKIDVKVDLLYTPEQLKEATPDEVHNKILEAIKFNDNDYQIDNHIRFRSKALAENLNFILYKCPVCGAEYHTSADKDILTCNACGNKVRLTEYGVLEPVAETDKVVYDRIDDWFAYERKTVREELIEKGDDFYFETPVTLSTFDAESNSHVVRGGGRFVLTTTDMAYIGTIDDDPVDEHLSIKEMNSLSTKRSEAINFPHGDIIYRLRLDEHKYATLITLYVEELYRLSHGLPEHPSPAHSTSKA